MSQAEGLLIKGIGGFYYVQVGDTVYECKAKGIHRKNRITPLAGDAVTISFNPSGYCSLDEIHERKNFLNRPPVANVDKLFILASTREPMPSTFVIDKFTAIAQDKGIDCAVVFTKTDLAAADELVEIYQKSGFDVFALSTQNDNGLEELKAAMNGKICVLCGNSGVGKSTLLNRLCPELRLETGEISEKLGRGRHTTRQVELFRVGDGYIADTPGFAAIELDGEERIVKENLPFAFREFLPYLGRCRFTSCTHVADKGCLICQAVEEGRIMPSRHESYVALYNEAKNIKDWELKTK